MRLWKLMICICCFDIFYFTWSYDTGLLWRHLLAVVYAVVNSFEINTDGRETTAGIVKENMYCRPGGELKDEGWRTCIYP